MAARTSLVNLILALLLGLIFINLAVLDYALIFKPSLLPTFSNTLPSPVPITVDQSKNCAPSCEAMIRAATSTAQLSLSPSPTPSTVPKTVKPTTSSAQVPRVYYIPLGTGYTESNEWVDVAGTDTTLNPSDYGKIKQVTFEASMHIPVANGTIYARLYNVTDKHPVWFSEVSTGQGKSTSVSSGNITLDAGSKVYRVQIKTSLQYPSYLDFSRIVVTLQ